MASSARIDELRKKFDENPRRYFAPLANEYRKAGEIEEAIRICREYLPAQPGHMSGHIVYGQALYEARQFEEAKAVFETALSLDPENLIALRHLGDIALIIGDTTGARGWYGRVLEADPRNEEIQAQLKTLEQAAGMASADAAPAAATPVTIAAVAKPAAPKPTPSSAPTVVQSAVRTPPPAPQQPLQVSQQPQSVPAPVEPPVERPVKAVKPPPASPAAETRTETVSANVSGSEKAASEPPIQALQLESPVSGASAHDAPPLDGFSLEGLETTSLTAAAPAAPAPATALPELDLGPVAAAPPAPTRPPAPAAALPDLELASPTSAPTSDAVPVPDLDFAEPAASAPPPGPARSPVADLPMLDLGEVAAPPAPAPDSGPFVTETMAELYLQQGHREEALRMYRALVDQRPHDPALRAKVSHLEAELSPRRAPPVLRAPRVAPTKGTNVVEGPTIREVLSLVALRRPGSRPEAPQENGAPTAPPAAPAPAATSAATPAAGRAASLSPDAIGTIFGSPRISAEDERAAMALALAYLELNGAERSTAQPESRGIAGAPARPAATELSLDSVFGTSERSPAAPSSFSFDQFFSQRATAQSATPEASSGGRPNAQSDVAQFTQWLEGLKQR